MKWLWLAATLLQQGCATVQPFTVENPGRLAGDGSAYEGKATVVVFRDTTMPGAALTVHAKLDNVDKGSLRRGTYVTFAADPGTHELLLSWPMASGGPDVAVVAELAAGKTYYFAFSTGFSVNFASMTFSAGVEQIDKAQADVRLTQFKERPSTPDPEKP